MEPVLLHLAFLQGTTAVPAGTAAVLFATGGASAKDRLRKLDPVFMRLRYLLDNPPSSDKILSKISPCCDGAFVLNLKGAGGLLTKFRGVEMMIAHPLEGASIFHAMASSQFECDVSVEKTFLTFSSRAEEPPAPREEDISKNRRDKGRPPSAEQGGDSKNRSVSAPPSRSSGSSSSSDQQLLAPASIKPLPLLLAPSSTQMVSCYTAAGGSTRTGARLLSNEFSVGSGFGTYVRDRFIKKSISGYFEELRVDAFTAATRFWLSGVEPNWDRISSKTDLQKALRFLETHQDGPARMKDPTPGRTKNNQSVLCCAVGGEMWAKREQRLLSVGRHWERKGTSLYPLESNKTWGSSCTAGGNKTGDVKMLVIQPPEYEDGAPPNMWNLMMGEHVGRKKKTSAGRRSKRPAQDHKVDVFSRPSSRAPFLVLAKRIADNVADFYQHFVLSQYQGALLDVAGIRFSPPSGGRDCNTELQTVMRTFFKPSEKTDPRLHHNLVREKPHLMQLECWHTFDLALPPIFILDGFCFGVQPPHGAYPIGRLLE